ncbi:porin [Psychrobacter sp. DM8]|uniref:porin n=1 Tax=Psychrobacter sp. DM8 TaxID=3440636 RepID=UPI003F4F4C99
MKKLLLATAVAALSVSAAQAAPTVYGKIFITTDYVNADNDVDDSDSLQINSNISRIGFKGSEAMTANTDVIYQLEYGIAVDGEDRTFQSRDTYLGLDNQDFGQFRFGRNYSVVDYVNNVTVNEGYWDNLGPASADFGDANLIDALNMTDANRVNNSIVWIAPKYNDLPLELALMYGADEDFVVDSDDRSEGFGASLMFDPGMGFTAGVAYSNDLNIPGSILRGTASVDLSNYVAYPVTVGAMYQQTDFDTSDDFGSENEDGFVISAEMGLNNFARPATVYAQYNNTSNIDGFDNADSDQLVVGGTYEFKKNMIAHAYIGQNSADLNDVQLLQDDGETLVTRGNDLDVFAIGGGLEYIF